MARSGGCPVITRFVPAQCVAVVQILGVRPRAPQCRPRRGKFLYARTRRV